MTEANSRLGWVTQTCSAYKARLKFKKTKRKQTKNTERGGTHHTQAVPVPKKWRPEGQKFKASPSYIEKSRSARLA